MTLRFLARATRCCPLRQRSLGEASGLGEDGGSALGLLSVSSL